MTFKPLTLTTQSESVSDIIVGIDLDLRVLLQHDWTSIHVIYDSNVAAHAKRIAKLCNTTNLICVENAEQSKSFTGLQTICEQLASQKADRHSLVINVGGGALCDLGGFAAAIYMRGITFAHIPTTLLAQVDASVGGKTAINAFGIKNSIGSFTQPRWVLVDAGLIRGLPERDFASGCAELLKHGLIADVALWEELSTLSMSELRADEQRLARILHRSCEIKYEIVASDEHETGERKKLNFGHTVGHAIEAISHKTDQPYLHGEAVAIGMIAEAALSQLSSDDVAKIRDVLSAYSLPVTVRDGFSKEAVMQKMTTDKKNKNGTIRWTVLNGIGDALYDQTKQAPEIEQALQEIGL